MDKQHNVKLTASEIETLMYVLEGYSAKVKIEAMRGERDKTKAKELTTELCALNSKLFQRLYKIHEQE